MKIFNRKKNKLIYICQTRPEYGIYNIVCYSKLKNAIAHMEVYRKSCLRTTIWEGEMGGDAFKICTNFNGGENVS